MVSEYVHLLLVQSDNRLETSPIPGNGARLVYDTKNRGVEVLRCAGEVDVILAGRVACCIALTSPMTRRSVNRTMVSKWDVVVVDRDRLGRGRIEETPSISSPVPEARAGERCGQREGQRSRATYWVFF